jgi:hypothetical protein
MIEVSADASRLLQSQPKSPFGKQRGNSLHKRKDLIAKHEKIVKGTRSPLASLSLIVREEESICAE